MTFEEIWQGCDLAQIDQRRLVDTVATLQKTGLRAVRDPRDPNAVQLVGSAGFAPSGDTIHSGDMIRSADEVGKQLAIIWECINRFIQSYKTAIDFDRLVEHSRSRNPLTDDLLQDINDMLTSIEKQRVSDGKPAMWEMFAEALLGSDWQAIIEGTGYRIRSGEVKRA